MDVCTSVSVSVIANEVMSHGPSFEGIDISKCLLRPAYTVEVMFSSCLSVCRSVRAITFEGVDIETSFFV